MEVLNQVETLTLRELEETRDTILYVLNNTQPRGQIVFNITTSKGRDHTVIIPDTWIPFDLSTQAKKSELIDSPSFRRAVSQRFIIPIGTDSADNFMTTNEHANNELGRIFNLAGGNNSVAANSINTSKIDQIRQKAGGVSIASEAVGSTESISGAVIQIINRSNSEGEDKMDVKEAISLLLGRKLNTKELDYAIKNSMHSDIKTFASKQI